MAEFKTLTEDEKKITASVYDIQGFSVQDGPGIRTTVFLKGCPLRCPWCHSPESQRFDDQVLWISMRCLGIEACGRCMDKCPTGALEPGRFQQNSVDGSSIQLPHIKRAICTDCGKCTEKCYPKALYVCGEKWTVEDMIEHVLKDKPFYEASGGGVTISGGECLCQPDFTVAFLKGLKELGIHTAVDTTGFCKWEILERTLPYADLYLYDLKCMNSELHKKIVQVPNEPIIENVQKLAAAGGKMQIRIPVIPQFNDNEENIIQTAELCQKLGDAVTVVQLLPYHNLGVSKYQRIDEDKKVLEAVPPSDEKMQSLKQIFEKMGVPVTIH